MTGTQGASFITSSNTPFQASARSAFWESLTMASAAAARLSRAGLQYQDQFQPPLTAPAQPRMTVEKSQGSGKTAIQARPPDHTMGAWPSVPPASIAAGPESALMSALIPTAARSC